MKFLGRVQHWALSDQGQGYRLTLKLFPFTQYKLSGAISQVYLYQLWNIEGR